MLVKCDKCGMEWGGGANIKLYDVKCWRADCPGAKPEPPPLKAVK